MLSRAASSAWHRTGGVPSSFHPSSLHSGEVPVRSLQNLHSPSRRSQPTYFFSHNRDNGRGRKDSTFRKRHLPVQYLCVDVVFVADVAANARNSASKQALFNSPEVQSVAHRATRIPHPRAVSGADRPDPESARHGIQRMGLGRSTP